MAFFFAMRRSSDLETNHRLRRISLITPLLDTAFRKRLKSQTLQAVTNQQCRRLVKFDVHRWFATAQPVIIHAGQVIMRE